MFIVTVGISRRGRHGAAHGGVQGSRGGGERADSGRRKLHGHGQK